MDEENIRDEAEEKLKEAFDKLGKLPPEERIDIYESLLGGDVEGDGKKKLRINIGSQIIVQRNLGSIVGFKRDNVEVSPEGYVVPRQPQVFLSHSHADKKLVRNLASKLKENKIKVWLDEAELKFGDSLIQRLRKAIDSVDLLLVVISKSSVASSWVEKEVEIAMNEEIDNKRIKVVPVVIEDVELPGFLKGKFFADFTTSYRRKKNLPKLVESLKAHLGSQ